MVGLEPLRSGYLRFKKIKKIDGENLTIINQGIEAVSYTHLTLPTNREV